MTTVFGRRYNHDESNSSYEVEEVREMVMEGFEILGAFNWSDYVPWISFFYDPLRIRERCSVLAPRVKKFVKRVLEEHRIMPSFKELSDDSDFVDVLLSLEGDDKLQDDDIIAVLWVCVSLLYLSVRNFVAHACFNTCISKVSNLEICPSFA